MSETEQPDPTIGDTSPSPDELSAWAELAEKATSGPWNLMELGPEVSENAARTGMPDVEVWEDAFTIASMGWGETNTTEERTANAAFFVAAREGWPRTMLALSGTITALERANARIAELTEKLSAVEAQAFDAWCERDERD